MKVNAEEERRPGWQIEDRDRDQRVAADRALRLRYVAHAMVLVSINVRRTEADVTHQLTVVSLPVRDRGPARVSKTRYERRMKLQGVRACAKDSDEQTLLMPAR
jgi:hypothetical protein